MSGRMKATPGVKFHGNTIAIALVARSPLDIPDAVFSVVQRKIDPETGEVQTQASWTLGHQCQSAVFEFSNGDLLIRRLPGGLDQVGFLINTGIRNVSFEYLLEDPNKAALQQVGPTTDTLLMGHAREIGCGPNLTWKVTTFRGRSEPEHEAMRKA